MMRTLVPTESPVPSSFLFFDTYHSRFVLIACRKRNILTHPIVTLVFARVPCAVRMSRLSSVAGAQPDHESSDR